MKHDVHIKWLIDTLESWNETFQDQDSDDDLPLSEHISILNQYGINGLSSEGIDDVIFHLWQKFGQEED